MALALVIFVSAISALSHSSVSASPGGGATVYGTDAGTTGLYEINKTTGVGVLKGIMGIGTAPALATDPLTGNLYAGTGGSNNDLYIVNPANAMSTQVGSGAGLGGAGFGGFDFDGSGQLWASANIAGSNGGIAGTGSDYLVKINKTTGIATVVGPFGTCTGVSIPAPAPGTDNGSCTIEGIETIAFDSSGQLWGIENVRGSAGSPGLYTINKTTGAATFVTAIDDAAAGLHPSGGVVAMQFDCNGTLYAGTARRNGGANNDGGMLGTVNTTTGLFTFISSAPITTGSPANSLGGLADVPSNCPFNVNKDFVPNDPGSVTVSLSCTNGGSGMALDSSASEADDANFIVDGFTLGSDPTCTASETGVPAGYTTGNTCSALLSAGSCTIVNPETSTTFTVNKVYSPGGPLTPVSVSVTCTSGNTAPSSGSAAPGSPFVSTVTHFNVSGTTCSASESVPAGYVATSNCTNVPISHGVPASCTITNTAITPSPSPTPVSSAVGGFVELATGGSDDGGGGSGSLAVLAFIGAAFVLAAGGSLAFARARARR
jgi:hypothetical protein